MLEPAAFGTGVLFGPQHNASRDARQLLDADAAMSVGDADSLADILGRWLRGADDWQAIGNRARAVVHEGLGAAERSYALVAELLR